MKVTPRTENEIVEQGLLPDGWYPFRIIEAEQKTSKAGNEMMVINVQAFRGAGSRFIKDFLMDNEFSARKLRNLANTCNILDKYEAGGFETHDLENKEGYARIGVEKSKDAKFPAQNRIWDYAKEAPADSKTPVAPKPAPGSMSTAALADDDNIPF